MFSSNQILDISCTTEELSKAIAFCMSLYGDEMFKRTNGRVKVAFSEPMPGVYAIGTGSMEPVKNVPNGYAGHGCPKGWMDYPFDYDPAIIAGIIAQWLKKQPEPPHISTDGGEEVGARVRSLHSMESEYPSILGIPGWELYTCVLLFTPTRLFYAR